VNISKKSLPKGSEGEALVSFVSGKLRLEGVPPLPPHPVKGLRGAGCAKSVCKILRAKELEVKILITGDLGSLLRAL
jgi:hypothetical protein